MWQVVLARFGKTKKAARSGYRKYVSEGVEQGRRPDLVGGGLIRSLGGWFEVKVLRKMGGRESTDERILGSGDFVERIIKESEKAVRRQFSGIEQREHITWLVGRYCDEQDINIKELRNGSRWLPVARLWKRLIHLLVEEEGVSLAETTRQLGVSTSAVSKSLNREQQESHDSQ